MTDYRDTDAPEWVTRFLPELERLGTIAEAARAIELPPQTAYSRRQTRSTFAADCELAVARFQARTNAPEKATRAQPWRKTFLETLAETSCVRQAAGAANKTTPWLYAERRRDADFARAWRTALADGYDALESELLAYLRERDPERKMDVAGALRLLAAHRETVAGERARMEHSDEAAILDRLNAKLDAMRRNELALEATLAENGTYRIEDPDGRD